MAIRQGGLLAFQKPHDTLLSVGSPLDSLMPEKKADTYHPIGIRIG